MFPIPVALAMIVPLLDSHRLPTANMYANIARNTQVWAIAALGLSLRSMSETTTTAANKATSMALIVQNAKWKS